MKKTTLIDKETLEKEEQEAKERGITIFQLRHYKKLSEKRKKGQQKYIEEKKKEKERQIEKENRKKEREKEKKLRKKEENREKCHRKKEKNEEIVIEKRKEPVENKKSVGRPKKRGRKVNYYKRKRKKIELERKALLPPKTVSWNYKVVSCRNGNQNGFIGTYDTVEKAYEKVNELLRQSENVVFPSLISHSDKIVNTRFEYLILERKTEESTPSFLRNEYGKLVEQKTNSEEWNIFDKFQYNVEETFWVWGYDNKRDRKTFEWIYNNILIGKIYTNYDLRFVCLYKNKVIFKDDDENLDIVFCKTTTDALRFYNLLETYVKKDKVRQVFFLGAFNTINPKRKRLEQQLIETTGWTKKKIQMISTSEHTK